jgi:hypothetical protein
MADFTKPTKNYIKGSAKEQVFDNGGSVINVDLLFSDLEKLPRNQAGYIKIRVSKLKQADQYGSTHSVYENDYKPKEKQPAPIAKTPVKAREKDALPWE